MDLSVSYCLVLFFFLSCAGSLSAQEKVTWRLVWQDEFSTGGKPDSSKWGFSGRARPNWACYCYDDTTTVVVHDGKLLLRGIRAKEGTDTARYQTGCIQTKGKFSFLYGKLEVRAKLPQGQGSWPAIWLMPEESKYGGWTRSGEIDVMEHVNFDTVFYQTVHSHYTYNLKQTKNPTSSGTTPFRRGEFNVFGMEWYPDKIDFFVNGQKTFSYPKLASDTTGTQWPFDQPFYIILNQALGGTWTGPVNDAHLPQQHEIDYVRVYQLQ